LSELLQKLTHSRNLVALQLPGKEAFHLIPRQDGVPAGYIALAELSDGRMAVVPAGADAAKQSPENISLFRAGPITLSLRVQPIRTADGHEVACSLTFRVAVRPDVNDLNGLLREFATRSKPEVETADILKYLEEHVLVAARVFAHGKSAAEMLAPASASALAEHLATSLQRPLLSVGLAQVPGMMAACLPLSPEAISSFASAGGALGAPPSAGVAIPPEPPASAPSAAAVGGSSAPAGRPAQPQEILHAALLGQFDDLADRATACGEDKVAEALRKLRTKVAGQTAFTAFDQVMQVLPERLRAEVYDALVKLFAADPAERLVAAAASLVACWKLPEVSEPAWKATLPSDLGGCRSVRMDRNVHGQPVVLVGCQRGVVVMDAQTGSMTAMLLEPYSGASAGASQSSGYNAAALRRGQCWASKSDFGLVCWELDRPTAPYAVLHAGRNQPARFVRAVVVDAAGVIWCGADNWLVRCPGGLPTVPDLQWFVPIDSPVTSAQIDGEDLWLGTQAGGLWRIGQFDPRGSQLLPVSPHHAVEALTVRRTGMVRWVIYADGKSAIIRTASGDYSRALTGTTGVRAARAAGPWLAGLNDWRDAMMLWNCSSLGRQPVAVTIQRLANARIQDFDLG
jgi:hypothetical protein